MTFAVTFWLVCCQSANRDFGSTDKLGQKTSKEAMEMLSQESRQGLEEELEALVLRINSDIASGEYEKWLLYLSSDYMDNYNSREILSGISLSPRLGTRGMVLTDLKDYYEWVVMPSRHDAKLESIEIATEKRAIAYSMYKGSKARLYELEKIHGEWRITIWK